MQDIAQVQANWVYVYFFLGHARSMKLLVSLVYELYCSKNLIVTHFIMRSCELDWNVSTP